MGGIESRRFGAPHLRLGHMVDVGLGLQAPPFVLKNNKAAQ
jgi:hypothetical protein